MFKQLKLVASLAITATLMACGGGGDSGASGAASVSVNNPLKKYEGTYYVCDANEKDTVAFSATGADGLNVSFSAEIYSGANCSGSIIGSYKWNAPALITYKDTTSATLPPATVFPFSATVDRVTLLTSLSTATLTGSGVKDNCVSYSYINNGITSTGKDCFELVLQQSTDSGGLYLTADNQYLVQLSLQNGVLATDQILSRSSTFNLASLVKR